MLFWSFILLLGLIPLLVVCAEDYYKVSLRLSSDKNLEDSSSI